MVCIVSITFFCFLNCIITLRSTLLCGFSNFKCYANKQSYFHFPKQVQSMQIQSQLRINCIESIFLILDKSQKETINCISRSLPHESIKQNKKKICKRCHKYSSIFTLLLSSFSVWYEAQSQFIFFY